MTKVFVHGNPETRAIWDDLLVELAGRGITDVLALNPPGFGAPTPEGWGGTQREYRDWLVDELSRVGGEIDLVGHDWGAGHVFGALAEESVHVRTWAADCAGLMHPEYVWHDAAQAWQTPAVGEDVVKLMTESSPEEFAAMMAPLGMRDGIAQKVAASLDGDTARCILSLYRSAAQPAMAALGERFRRAAPHNGMVIVAENDHFAGTPAMHEEVASWTGATVARLAGVGHWWMIENPRAAADVLLAHWGS